MSAAWWCERAWLGGEGVEHGVLVEADGERIAAVSAGAGSPPAGATALRGLVVPGLANAHSHSFQRALRGRTHSGRGDFWAWRATMYALAQRVGPGAFHALARATFAEMALAGITCVGEFHYLHHGPGGRPYDDPNELGLAVMDAAEAAGIRVTLVDACYLHGGIGEELDPAQRRFADADAEAWATRVAELRPGPGARIGAAIHSVRAVDPASAATVARAARGGPLHAHLSEQPAENAACIEAYGLTPAGVLAEAGAVDEAFTAVHATHVTDDDRRLLGAASATCCLCPSTERDLADGIGAARALTEAGASLAVGSDSQALIDLFEEARAIELDERLATGRRGSHRASELLEAATASGHACLGWPEAGRIEPGAPCDLVAVDLDSPRLAGTDDEDLVAAVVFACQAADVTDVVASGREIVRDGMHAEIDVPAELRHAIAGAWA